MFNKSFSDQVRSRFPALNPELNPLAPIFLDNPGGTQVPLQVVHSISDYLTLKNANLGGAFVTSVRSGETFEKAHQDMAQFLNATSAQEIVFGQNMTTLTLQMSRALGHRFQKGDEIIITEMEHDANYTPWVLMARDHELVVKVLPFNRDTFEFDLDALDALLSPKTRLLCMNHASNMTGTINDVALASKKARSAGALVYVDSVQFAPHGVIDVQEIDCDFLVCSPYKFFGPHLGVLWGRHSVLSEIHPYKLNAASDDLPDRFETGTLNYEGMAGVSAVMDYFEWIGGEFCDPQTLQSYSHFEKRRQYICAAMDFCFEFEKPMARYLIEGLNAMKGVHILGITDPGAMDRRVPTVSFTIEKHQPLEIANMLGKRNVQVWNGHNYAIAPMSALGLLDQGGAIRIGLAHYNTMEEIDFTLSLLGEYLQ